MPSIGTAGLRIRSCLIAAALFWVLGCGTKQPGIRTETCIGYPPPQDSEYILPFAPGPFFTVIQGNCAYTTDDPRSHVGQKKYAYDFGIPIGTSVLAARSGTVEYVRDRYSDHEHGEKETNVIAILHEDGTLALYAHITFQGALVATGQWVSQGQRIALSGNSGPSPEPHLHFQVSACGDLSACPSLPVSFRNVFPPAERLETQDAYRAR